MAINLLFNQTIDYSVSDLLNLAVGGNILITKDAGTPAGDPVVVNLSDLADAQALSKIVVENGATAVVGGGLASLKALSGVIVDGGTLELSSNIANIDALNSISIGPDGGTIKVDSSLLGLGVLSFPVNFVDQNGNTTTTAPSNFTVDFPDSTITYGHYDPLTNQTTIGLDLNLIGLINVSLGPSLVISGNPFGLDPTGLTFTTWTSTSNPDGSGGILICYLTGSMIHTPSGDVAVEDLRIGDRLVAYVDGAEDIRPVTWVGTARATVRPHLPDDEAGYPVRILRDAIADGVPYKDMLITPEHCLFLNGTFVPVRMLVNGRSIFYDRSLTSYTYYHVETQAHSVIRADGVLSESYLDTGNRKAFRQTGAVVSIGGRVRNWSQDAAAPLNVSREHVEPLFRKLQARAGVLGYAAQTAPPALNAHSDLHLVTDRGQSIHPTRMVHGHALFMLPSGVGSVRLVSRTAKPSRIIGPFVDDRRNLGVLVGEVTLHKANTTCPIDSHLTTADLPGWAESETAPFRWTTGNATLPLGDGLAQAGAMLSIQLMAGGPYIVEADAPLAEARSA
ncbi:Hint domain-containing protein [Acetobacter sp. TBRC 12305]|uniref:Hint domain-containing protein n=1 Tax=Acetobacter garciniae TaxID=2817435 RepID=A0A939HPY0_9PROT|nr:Hint domain-containing protein [Acetobacter garciniae]MBO1325186.1 Hint domain-containing protein [Acetobacter garciniae]MBX0344843.1 Hint domain-containing protein [Acetobacter garciniae]